MRTNRLPMLAAVLVGGCIIVDGGSSLTIANRSSHLLHEVHLADVGDQTWGPDLLAGSLAPGQDLVIDGIDCGRYDVLVVDGGDVECMLTNLHLCFDDHVWTITDTTLASCAFGP